MFAMFTIVPAITGAFGVIPMLFYDLDGKKKEIMYAELLERRARLQKAADSGDVAVLESESKKQRQNVDK